MQINFKYNSKRFLGGNHDNYRNMATLKATEYIKLKGMVELSCEMPLINNGRSRLMIKYRYLLH